MSLNEDIDDIDFEELHDRIVKQCMQVHTNRIYYSIKPNFNNLDDLVESSNFDDKIFKGLDKRMILQLFVELGKFIDKDGYVVVCGLTRRGKIQKKDGWNKSIPPSLR